MIEDIQFELFLEHAPAAIAMFDREMRYIAASRRWREDYHIEEPIVGRSHYDVFPEIPERWREVHRRAMAGETVRQEAEPFARADGALQWLRWEVGPWRRKDGSIGGIVIFTRDITASKAVESELRLANAKLKTAAADARENREFLRSILNSLPQEVAVLDLSGRITAVNEPWARFAQAGGGVSPAVWVGANYLEVCRAASASGDEVARKALEGLQDVLSGARTSFNLEYPCPSPDSERWFEMRADRASLETVGVVVSHTEITARKEMETAMREGEQRFRTLAEMSPTAIMVYQDGRYVYANPTMVRLLGAKAPEDVLALTPFQIVTEPYHQFIRDRVRIALDEGRSVPMIEYQWRRLDGSLIDVEVASSPVTWRGRPAVQAVARDITERLSMTRALKEADRRKDEFLATLAHELRNPLAPVSNGLHLLARSQPFAAENGEILTMMERQVRHLVRLVDDLLEVARVSSGKIELKKERVELKDVLRHAVDASRPLIDKEGHRLAIDLPDEEIELDADPVRLGQIFANLLNNAAKFTDTGARIWLTARRAGDQAVVTVSDEGVGIAAEALPRVFDLFAQHETRRDRINSGLGIGLALARTLAELHGGSIEAESEPGKGSAFTVRLPVAARARDRDERAQRAYATRSATARVLIVDDERDVGDSLAMLVRALGAETKVVYDGEAAVEAALRFAPHLALLDIKMPAIDGYETARRIRALPGGEAITLVALTGWGQPETRRRANEAGFDSLFVKPIDIAALEGLLAAAAAKAAAEADPDPAAASAVLGPV